MKGLKHIAEVFFALLITLVLIPIVIIAIPIIGILMSIERLLDNKKLKKQIKKNDGNIFFLFADYNEYDFSSYFKNKKVFCIKVSQKWNANSFVDYIVKDCSRKCFPQLVKINNGKLIRKTHYNSFKFYRKRNNDIDSFFELVEASIKNLENENQDTG